jgi:AcrR family transcriptional regulator
VADDPTQGSSTTRSPGRAGLSRGEVLAATLALIDADGIEALSMRRLGRALGRDPMRLYRHAASKDALLDGVVELVLAELDVSAPHDAGDWEEVLRSTAHAFRAVAVAHPHVVPILVTRPELAAYDGVQGLDEGLDVVLVGLRQQARTGAAGL